jgi:TolB protein
LHISADEIELTVSGAQQTQMPIAIIVLDESNTTLNQVAEFIKKDLQFTDQFQPCIKKYNAQLPKKTLRRNIKKLSAAGIPLALCLNSTSPENIQWRLYDTIQCTMIQAKNLTQKSSITRAWAHSIADEVWKTLTGNNGFFSSRLAYCKDSKNHKGHTIRKVYLADFDGTHEELLVDVPTICVAPRWHPTKPQISYSEYADTNVRLMSVEMNKKRKPLSDFDGINMLASFSDDGATMTYCSSRGSGSCQIYLIKNNSLKRCTNNTGNNTSPIFINEDQLCFCSDFQTGSPQIYIANIHTGHLQRITPGGYCTSPSYCQKTNKIAYHKMIHGIMQVMMYDCATKTHTQTTKTKGSKHEVSWSPCGTQLLFVHEIPGKNSRLSSLNLLTNKTRYLTSAYEQCSYPHWSPCYQTFPVVT